MNRASRVLDLAASNISLVPNLDSECLDSVYSLYSSSVSVLDATASLLSDFY